MVVAFTANIGLAKPDENELALNWSRSTKLAEDNNIIIADQADVNLTTYVPAFIAATTNPNIGTGGTIIAEYCRVNNMVFGTFMIRVQDPGVLPGTGVGSYGISLPFLADTTFHTVATSLADNPGTASCVGEGHMTDSSSVPNSGSLAFEIAHIGGVAYLRPITEAYAGKTARWFGPTVPFTLATADGFSGTFIYKAA